MEFEDVDKGGCSKRTRCFGGVEVRLVKSFRNSRNGMGRSLEVMAQLSVAPACL